LHDARRVALTKLWTPNFGAVTSERVRAALFQAFDHPGVFIQLPASVPFVEEVVVTSDIDATSPPVASIHSGHIQILGLQYVATMNSHKIRARVPTGWLTIIDMDTLATTVDSKPWPPSCTPAVRYGPGKYIVASDETPVTASRSSASHDVRMLLNRGDRIEADEVAIDSTGEKKLRARLVNGGWVTILNLKSCALRMLPLLPPLPQTSPSRMRRGSFLVVGDWGWDVEEHIGINERTCQEMIGLKMLQVFERLGDVQFIVNVGDSFYPNGVSSATDPQWQTKWRDVYDAKLRTVPWYSTYGNHDLHIDRCACTLDVTQCAQINANASDRERFYMPAPSYIVDHPDMDLEVIGLDTNGVGEPNLCQFTTCPQQCPSVIQQRYRQGLKLFQDRLLHSGRRNFVIFSHYPTDMLPYELVGGMRWDKRRILYVGGHRHSTDNTSTIDIGPGESWVVGGGGGWSCDGNQGFLVGQIDADGNMGTFPIFVENNICCGGIHQLDP